MSSGKSRTNKANKTKSESLIELRRRWRPIKVGDPVLIIEDVREGSPATGQIGQYEGDFPKIVTIFWRGDSFEVDYDLFISGEVKMTDGRPAKDVIPPYSKVTKAGWFVTDNPRILLPDGTHIWGVECWWKTIEPGEQVDLQKAQERLVNVKEMFADEYKRIKEGSSK